MRMTAKERILRTLTWVDPDRVPLTVYDSVTEDAPLEALERSLGIIASVLQEMA